MTDGIAEEVFKEVTEKYLDPIRQALEKVEKKSYELGLSDGREEAEQEYAGKVEDLKKEFEETLKVKEEEYKSTMESYRTEIEGLRKEVNEATKALTYFMSQFADVEEKIEELEKLPEISKEDVKKVKKKAKKLLKKLQ
ncbi:MAG: hypothetical protein J7L45_03560 [Candidatus Aenigmarchaeota archaeon]|nr:hypothetical protein [Candidatus Aenigmarchaeota archaeon]